MIVEPRPGANLERLQTEFRDISGKFPNIWGGTGTVRERYNAYIDWANSTARRLRSSITIDSLNRVVLTRRYWLLQEMGHLADTPSVHHLLDAELDEMRQQLELVNEELVRAIARWTRIGTFVVGDTSFFIHADSVFTEFDFAQWVGLRGEPIHLLIPMIVIDELDGLKRAKESERRGRARFTLALLEKHLPNATDIATLRQADFSGIDRREPPIGEVTAEVVFDEPWHVRLPIDDDELIDRSVMCQALVGRPMTLFTFDTHQSFRAKAAGLNAIRLREKDDPPAPAQSLDTEPSGG